MRSRGQIKYQTMRPIGLGSIQTVYKELNGMVRFSLRLSEVVSSPLSAGHPGFLRHVVLAVEMSI